MEQATSLKEAIEEIQDLKIHAVALQILVNTLKGAIEVSDPRMKKAFAEAKDKFIENFPSDTDASRKVRDQLIRMTQDW